LVLRPEQQANAFVKKNCSGPKCRKEHGVVWYAYRECPTCECVAAVESTSPSTPSSDAPSKVFKNEQQFDEPELENIESFTLIDWIQDHWRELIAVFSTLFLICIAVIFIFSLSIRGDDKDRQPATTKKLKVAKSKSSAKQD